tara:strand:- start:519 stop:1040 length:522 start_codon:yes stop_codon:yes gene_type:complete
MSDKKSIQIKGKNNLDKLLNNPSKRYDTIIPIVGDEYKNKYLQIQLINCIYLNMECGEHMDLIKKVLMKKLRGYRYQDIKKCILCEKKFITFDKMIERLVESKLQCFYCNCDLTIIYDDCRQKNQWTLDRIDNTSGHNIDNVLISCLECNLKRRDMDKDKFYFTQNLQIKKID